MSNFVSFVARSRQYFRIGIAGSTDFRDTEGGFTAIELREACALLGQKLYQALGDSATIVTGTHT